MRRQCLVAVTFHIIALVQMPLVPVVRESIEVSSDCR
jgi:hypothetical protein